MTAWVIIPAKGAPAAKGRLAGALAPDDRERLSAAMLRAAIDAACGAVGADRVLIVGSATPALPHGVAVLDEPPGGLNAALSHGRDEALGRGAARVVSLAADLPDVRREDVLALIDLSEGTAAIAPDRHGTGTNALSLPFPAAQGFAYGYGIESCPRHLAEAARLGLPMQRIERPALARDIDEPSDLADARALLCQSKDA